MKERLEELVKATQSLSAEQLLEELLKRFGDRIALASSTGAEDQVLTDMLCRLTKTPRVFTLDTGRLPQETYEVIEATYQKYGLRIKMCFPAQELIEEMINTKGPNLFYESTENRKQCCYLRKVLPLRKELATLDAWITGLRREQSVTRAEVLRVEWDESNELIKVNPLADWSTEQVWQYIREHDVPYNRLHDQGYPSIGCAPCTRAVKEGEDIRSGRWWWELPEQKECGLHLVNGRLVRGRR
jgi:phosphoadenosine phosphosulfate reductase